MRRHRIAGKRVLRRLRGAAPEAVVAVSLCAGSFGGLSLCAETGSAAADTQALIDETWNEIRRLSEEGDSDESARIQRDVAGQLFEHYVGNPSTEVGTKALASAFMMWGNVGDAHAVDAALPRIASDSDAWAGLLNGINNAYVKSGRSVRELYRQLVRLDRRLTDPASRSELGMRLAEHHRYRGYEMESLGVGQPAPEFTAQDIEGRTISLAGLRGKIVVLEFWSTTCGPCMPEIPHLREMFEGLGADGVEIVGVSLDRELSVLRPFVVEEKMRWSQICDEMAYAGKIAKAYNVRGIPRSYVIDSHGRIAAKDARGEDLVAAVRKQLGRAVD